MHFDIEQQTLFLLIYGFLAWVVEVVYFAIKKRKFINRGLLSLPIDFEIGLVFSSIAVILPTMGRNYVWMYLVTLADLVIVRTVLGLLGGWLTRNAKWLEAAPSGTARNFLFNALAAGVILIVYLLLQPALIMLVDWLPAIVCTVIHIAAWVLIVSDFIAEVFAMRKGQVRFEEQMERGKTDELSAMISNFVWRRLERAYPGIRDENMRGGIVFARGLSLDKLIWVFFISALLGDFAETLWCGLVDGEWMSRSSFVFGPLSIIWGLGSVVLTICLMRLKDKNPFWILLAGGLLGGAFEYICSVFSEVLFGKVFWDYSAYPLNIGGRTNLLFMCFWALLGLLWVKLAYPYLARFIEKFPPLAAKICTWVLLLLLLCDALLTVEVLLRYDERQANESPGNVLEEFIDATYDDAFVEHRWQNMIQVDKSTAAGT